MKKGILFGCASALLLVGGFAYNETQHPHTIVAAATQTAEIVGQFEKVNKDALLKRINEIRKEAYEEGLVSQYVPMRWSSALETISKLRATEASIVKDHERPVGGNVFGLSAEGVQSMAENLAWNHSGALEAIEQFYGEKAEYVRTRQRTSSTGHYVSLIDPNYTYTALGSFYLAGGSYVTVAQQFSSGSGLNEDLVGDYGTYGIKISYNDAHADEVKKAAQASADYVEKAKNGTLNNNTTNHPQTGFSGRQFYYNGELVKNAWIQDQTSGVYYYIDGDGNAAQETWVGDYYLKQNGQMAASEWIYDSNYSSWFYLRQDGSYARNQWIGNYYLQSNGAMAAGKWIYDPTYSNWFYLRNDGSYARNQWIGNYYLTANGSMARSTWIGNYYVNADGLWTQTK